MSKKIAVTDIKRLLTEKVSPAPYSVVGPYGIAHQLKKFAGIDVGLSLNRCMMEHGIYVGRYVSHSEVCHHVPYILVFSPFREEVVKELADIAPIAIGPYIAYAEDYLPQKIMEKIKKKNGRTLLVMPSHSTDTTHVDYHVGQFIRQIEAARACFDTVMVSMHIEDLRRGMWKPYKKKGYHIVSAGNRENPDFLSRMRHIICLSDAVLVNEVTTGMAYAMHMDRPVRLIRQQMEYTLKSPVCGDSKVDVESRIEQICDVFGRSEFVITEKQREFGKYMFGLDSVKTKKEMKELLLSLSRTTA